MAPSRFENEALRLKAPAEMVKQAEPFLWPQNMRILHEHWSLRKCFRINMLFLHKIVKFILSLFIKEGQWPRIYGIYTKKLVQTEPW